MYHLDQANCQNWVETLDTCSTGQSVFSTFKDIFTKYRRDGNQADIILELVVKFLANKSATTNDDLKLLEIAYRSYYKILRLNERKDEHFLPQIDSLKLEDKCFIINAVLFVDYVHEINSTHLCEIVLGILRECIRTNNKILLYAIRNINLLYKRLHTVEIDFTLEEFYFCIQSHGYGIREETMEFFTQWAKCLSKSKQTFSTIVEYWPWSNKNKYQFLAAILSQNHIRSITCDMEHFNNNDFFTGMRLSLNFKKLFSSGQVMAKSLLEQNLEDFNIFLTEIIKNGTKAELINLDAQWNRYLNNKDELFEILELNECYETVSSYHWLMDGVRLPILFQLFYKQFSLQTNFKSIIDFLIANCFNYDNDIQLYIFKPIAEASFHNSRDAHTKLMFIAEFIEKHLQLPCASFRQTVLSRIPLIYDSIAKKHEDELFKPIIMEFFKKLRKIFDNGISHKEYQPLVFALKIFQIISKLAKSDKRLIKNADLSKNQKLSKFLSVNGIWVFEGESRRLLNLLRNSAEYDDVREIIVEILIELKVDKPEDVLWNCENCVSDNDIDRCFLSSYYTRLYINANEIPLTEAKVMHIYQKTYQKVISLLDSYQNDPLLFCKNGKHLFGYINCLNEIVLNKFVPLHFTEYQKIIKLCSDIVEMILRLLCASETDSSVPSSFQIMEESLQILVESSACQSLNHTEDKKFMLLSFWMTLQGCSDTTANVGCALLNKNPGTEDILIEVSKCLNVSVDILRRCRHKGAIEAAGVSLGKLVKQITIHAENNSNTTEYEMLFSCLEILFGSVSKVSTTRRGAGFSIMFHHLIKNEQNRYRPLLRHAIKTLLSQIKSKTDTKQNVLDTADECHENFDALVLHYLCVLIKDADLKEELVEYYDDIMLAAIMKMEEKEWTIRNGALQLFGALVPKTFGQKQATFTDEEACSFWRSNETTFSDIILKMPKTMEHILKYCNHPQIQKQQSFSIILFLEFLSNIEYIKLSTSPSHDESIFRYREMIWNLISNPVEKIRVLSSKCLAQFYEFRHELPKLIKSLIQLLFVKSSENHRHGLILSLIECVTKYQNNSKYITSFESFLKQIKDSFYNLYIYIPSSFYLKSYFVDFFILCKFNFYDHRIQEILDHSLWSQAGSQKFHLKNNIGFDIWKEKLDQIYRI